MYGILRIHLNDTKPNGDIFLDEYRKIKHNQALIMAQSKGNIIKEVYHKIQLSSNIECMEFLYLILIRCTKYNSRVFEDFEQLFDDMDSALLGFELCCLEGGIG